MSGPDGFEVYRLPMDAVITDPDDGPKDMPVLLPVGQIFKPVLQCETADVDLAMIHLTWSPTLKTIACAFHSVAIASTIFRLTYRGYMSSFWWDDGWAVFALVGDVLCLVAAELEIPFTASVIPHIVQITDWIASVGFPSVLWACRTSILFSIARVASPSQQFQRIACLVGCSFLIMWAALIGQRIQICIVDDCKMAASVGLSQLITDVFSDLSLVVLPIYLLRRTKINHRQRIMIYSAFSASLLITAVTIFHSIVLFTAESNGTIVIGHVKTALSLIVCNLLVIVSFAYRMWRRSNNRRAREQPISFTSVDLDVCLTDCGQTYDEGLMAVESSSNVTFRVEKGEKTEREAEARLA